MCLSVPGGIRAHYRLALLLTRRSDTAGIHRLRPLLPRASPIRVEPLTVFYTQTSHACLQPAYCPRRSTSHSADLWRSFCCGRSLSLRTWCEKSCVDFWEWDTPPLTRGVRVSFLTRVQLLLARHSGPRYTAFVAAVDDWACALVPTASSVTLLFYGLLFQDPRLVVEACVHMICSLPSPNHPAIFTGNVADAALLHPNCAARSGPHG